MVENSCEYIFRFVSGREIFHEYSAEHPLLGEPGYGMNEGTEGDFLRLSWMDDSSAKKVAWVRLWNGGGIKISGNDAWFGMPCEEPELILISKPD